MYPSLCFHYSKHGPDVRLTPPISISLTLLLMLARCHTTHPPYSFEPNIRRADLWNINCLPPRFYCLPALCVCLAGVLLQSQSAEYSESPPSLHNDNEAMAIYRHHYKVCFSISTKPSPPPWNLLIEFASEYSHSIVSVVDGGNLACHLE